MPPAKFQFTNVPKLVFVELSAALSSATPPKGLSDRARPWPLVPTPGLALAKGMYSSACVVADDASRSTIAKDSGPEAGDEVGVAHAGVAPACGLGLAEARSLPTARLMPHHWGRATVAIKSQPEAVT